MNYNKKGRIIEAIFFALTLIAMIWFVYKELYIK